MTTKEIYELSGEINERLSDYRHDMASAIIVLMNERGFNEIDLRKMLKAAKLGYIPGLKCGPGWIGSNKRKEAVLQLLGVKLENLTEAELIAIGEQRRAESEQRKAD